MNKSVDVPASRIREIQSNELVKQNLNNVVAGLATLHCPCGWNRALTKMYKCLYCDVWFCHLCAEAHFGKTVSEYRMEKVADTGSAAEILRVPSELVQEQSDE